MGQSVDLLAGLEPFASRVAVVDGERRFSYAELIDQADAFASSLPARALVFLESRNSVESIAAYLGCLRGGHVVHLFGDLDEARLAALVEAYEPNAVVRATEGGVEVGRRHARRLPLHPDLRVLLSTSGSTGSPKFVKLSERNLRTNALAIADYLGLTADDRAITSLKFNYSYGMSVINSHWAVGGSLVLSEESVSSAGFWSAFAAGQATSFAGVPYSFELLERDAGWASTPALRFVTQAGGKLAPELVRKFSALGGRHGWDFVVMYGQTEAAPRMAYLPPAEAALHADCIGRAIPGGELSLVDEAGAVITAEDRPGQLRYAGPNVMMGYARGGAELATDETPPFLLTGDIAVRTSAGLYRIVGRSARIVKPFGVRVDLDELQEAVRQRLPDTVCAGRDDGVVIATTQRPEPALVTDLAASLKLPPFLFEVVTVDGVPLLPNGKPDYQAVAALGGARAPAPAASAGETLKLVFSKQFLRLFVDQAANIVGLSAGRWSSVASIFEAIVAKGPVDARSTFTQLAGDSLSYVQTALALEEYLGGLPDDWENLTVAALEEARRRESAL